MAESESVQEEQSSPDLNLSPGEMLAQAREAKELTRIRVSEILGLTQATITDIELCRFEKFPSGIYVRGYLRNYCKLVEADEKQVLAAYDHYSETHEVPDESPFGSRELNEPGSGKAIKIGVGITLLAVAVVIAIIVFG